MPPPESPFAADQIVTVFRNRLRPGNDAAYREELARMRDLVERMPGLVEYKTFTAEDGERVTLVTFADEDSQRAWRERAEHRDAQRHGRRDYYSEYTLQVCRALRVSAFRAGPAPDSEGDI